MFYSIYQLPYTTYNLPIFNGIEKSFVSYIPPKLRRYDPAHLLMSYDLGAIGTVSNLAIYIQNSKIL